MKLNFIHFSLILILIVYSLNSFSQKKTYHRKQYRFNHAIEKYFKPKIGMNIPVSFNEINDEISTLVLRNKLDFNTNSINRPFFTNYIITYDSLLNLIDTTLNFNSYKKVSKKYFSIHPISIIQKYNSKTPYGNNDGIMSSAKGYQNIVTGGVYFDLKWLKINLRPSLFYSNLSRPEFRDNMIVKSIQNVNFGQSYIGFFVNKFSLSYSNENMWWGPGYSSSLLMSNNAPGFKHLTLKNHLPLNIFFGNLYFQLTNGNLESDTSLGFENYNFNKQNYTKKSRYINGLSIQFQPFFLKNVYFGINRIFQTSNDKKYILDIPINYLSVFNGFFKNRNNDDFSIVDQLLSVNSKLYFPKDKAELYFEFGYNDSKLNPRDFVLDISHSSSAIFGFRKIIELKQFEFIDYGFEILRMAQTPSALHRAAGNWYTHSQIIEGFTNLNQIIGVGSSLGNNNEKFFISWNNGWNKLGYVFQHTNNNPMESNIGEVANLKLQKILWSDFSHGISSKFKYKKLLFKLDIDFTKSRNYVWIKDKKQNNVHIMFNTTYLW